MPADLEVRSRPAHPDEHGSSPSNQARIQENASPALLFSVWEKLAGYACLSPSIYNGLPSIHSDHRRTSGGMPSGRGSFLLMHSANNMAVYNMVSKLTTDCQKREY